MGKLVSADMRTPLRLSAWIWVLHAAPHPAQAYIGHEGTAVPMPLAERHEFLVWSETDRAVADLTQ